MVPPGPVMPHKVSGGGKCSFADRTMPWLGHGGVGYR